MAVLDGIRVLDVSQVAAAPMCARHLGDFGADVIHIESPRTGDSFRNFTPMVQAAGGAAPSDFDCVWETYNRNKRSVTLDLALDGGREVLYHLIRTADVFITNLRPFELERYRVDYETLSKINPRLVWGCLTGYGREGPDKDSPAYDATALWARSGIPYMFTVPGTAGPGFRPAFGDNIAALVLAYGIMMALYRRERTGVGQSVDAALFHTGLYQLSFDVSGALFTGLDYADWRAEPPQEQVTAAREALAPIGAFYRARSTNPLAVPYMTSDGRALSFVALQPDRYWGPVCRAIGREDLVEDPRYSSFEGRAQHSVELQQILAEAFLSRSLEEWKPLLAGIPYAPVQTLREAVNDPQARCNGFFARYEHPAQGEMDIIANPVKMGREPATYRLPAPEFGQHTEEVLLEHGYDWDDIIRLKEQGVIA